MGPDIVRRVAGATTAPVNRAPGQHAPGRWVLAAGLVAFTVVLGIYVAYLLIHPLGWVLHALDLHVYYAGGLVVRHVRPFYNPHRAVPLYNWPPYVSRGHPFTYPPFAALLFSAASFISWTVLPRLTIAVNIVLLVASVWFTFGGLGYRRGTVRAGATMLVTAAVFLAEPVLRTIYLGQINLALMALIIWDLAQPDSRRWKGFGVGIAAGIKLVPLIFIPYLLLTRRFRQAIAAIIGFAVTVGVGYLILPADSTRWWSHEVFADSGRVVGFIGQASNQSLRGLATRLAGSMAAGQSVWVVAAVLATVAGLASATLLYRAGHQMPAVLACALTGLLISPVSWDHHWVWIVPGVAVAAHYAVAAMRTQAAAGTRWLRAALTWPAAGYWALVAGICVVYGAWPGSLWGKADVLGHDALGLIPEPPASVNKYSSHGDRPWFPEYHWHGLQLLIGNAFVLGGLALLATLTVLAVRVTVARADSPPARAAGGAQQEPTRPSPTRTAAP
jgi:alpha-1,2-mannosyltransferase